MVSGSLEPMGGGSAIPLITFTLNYDVSPNMHKIGVRGYDSPLHQASDGSKGGRVGCITLGGLTLYHDMCGSMF